ncbi:MAG: cytochrome d ubiquinol oxidase subunit II [Bacteroidota bacterium]|nr:cytochrome d ubiquinol oxidase subunit II [Bacteroidota bacterium]
MEILWFIIVSFMLAMYVILDGFDIGVGIIHRLIGKTESERALSIRTIGPVWDGNEVWLLAAGGTLYFAFPKLYASSFSGFYLPLTIVLWLLIMRALGIEFRHQINNSRWKSFWDTSFSISSILLAIFFGAALGNVIRGVPLNQEGYFFLPMWTTFTIVPEAGVLDWFTIIMGLVAFFTLMSHGANYIAMKTVSDIQLRARSIAKKSLWGVLITSVAAIVAISSIRPDFWNNYLESPLGFIFPIIGASGMIGMLIFVNRRKDIKAFISSTIFIGAMLAGTAFSLFPKLLTASTNPPHADYSITVYNAAAHEYGLMVGIVWWILGMILVAGYFIYLYRSFRGKISLSAEENGY